MQRFLILAGLVLLVMGLAWPLLSQLPFGRLPGDIRIERGGAKVFVPLVTCLVVSVVLSLLLRFFSR